MKYAQFQTLEAYLAQDAKIVAYKDNLTNREFTRTETEYYYTPEPEQQWDGFYYMEAKPEFQEAGLFDGCVLLDSIPVKEVETIKL
jgi:hypothetical protein